MSNCSISKQSKARKDTRLLNTTKVIKTKLSPTFNLAFFGEYLAVFKRRIPRTSWLAPWRTLLTIVYCLMPAKQRALLSSKLLKKQRQCLCKQTKSIRVTDERFNQMNWVDLAKPDLAKLLSFPSKRDAGYVCLLDVIGCDRISLWIHPLSRIKSSLICMSFS